MVEPMDVQAMSEAVLRLKHDAIYCQDLIAVGFTRAKQFTWRKSAEQLVSVYEQLMSQQSELDKSRRILSEGYVRSNA